MKPHSTEGRGLYVAQGWLALVPHYGDMMYTVAHPAALLVRRWLSRGMLEHKWRRPLVAALHSPYWSASMRTPGPPALWVTTWV